VKKLVSLVGAEAVLSPALVALAPAAERVDFYKAHAALKPNVEVPKPKVLRGVDVHAGGKIRRQVAVAG
jgi:hypothetical protein